MKRCVIVGASHAAAQLAPSLRQQGWEGEILVIGDEEQLPYHRPTLSKSLLSGEKNAEQILIRPEQAYAKADIKFRLGCRVEKINRREKTIVLNNGSSLAYDKLVLCLGGRARQATFPGASLSGVHYLRTLQNSLAVKQELQVGTKVVIVGGGYIGLETAAAMTKLGAKVTVLEMADRVLQRVTAPETSKFFSRVHQEHGVKIQCNSTVKQLLGEKHITAVETQDGETIAADLVIIGIGVIPNTELAADAGLAIENGIAVDQYGQSSDADIFAIGDCSFYPNTALAMKVRLESVPNALEQAKITAAKLCGKPSGDHNHPWFWSDQYDIKLQIAGYNLGYDQTVVRGDIQDPSFVVFYLRQGKLIAADCINSPKAFMQSKQLLSKAVAITAEQLSDPEFALTLPITTATVE